MLLSLHSEGIGSKWATGPVVQTLAFRDLVGAESGDRVVALVMIGGRDSAEFTSEREQAVAQVRRHRRRTMHGDLLVDLT